MPVKKRKKSFSEQVSVSLRKNPRLLLLPLFVVLAGVYFYHWFVTLHISSPDREEIVVYEETAKEPEAEVSSIEVVREPEKLLLSDIMAHVENPLSLENLPDMRQVMHVSRFLNLEAYINRSYQEHDISNQKTVNHAKTKIAIVIDDMGASPLRTNKISEIKAPLTSSFVTFATNLQKQIAKAQKSGHEIMIHVPMEPKSNIFVSDDVLKVQMSESQIEQTFSGMLKKFQRVAGVNNHMGSKFTEYGNKLAPVMKLLAAHHLFFLDSKTTSYSAAEQEAARYHVPYVSRDVFLDNEDNLEYILRQLEKTEKIARQNGYAIAIGHPKVQTPKALNAWLQTLSHKNIELVPLSEIVALVNHQ